MTLPTALNGHIHVSEREVPHHWPDGRFDNGAWEDCTFDSGLMFARLGFDLDIPALHREAEALRADSGEDPLGGTGTDDLVRGLRRRYGFIVPVRAAGFDELWKAPTPWVAEVQGSMGAFPSLHRLRRHQRSFGGAHAVFVARLTAEDRVWWDDPLAPTGSYQGEWVSKNELRSYVTTLARQFTPWAAIAKLRAAPIDLPDTAAALGRVRVGKGAWWDYKVVGTRAGQYIDTTRIQRTTDGFSAEFDSRTPEVTWKGAVRQWVRLSSGIYVGRWVDTKDTGSVSLLAA